LNDDWLLLPSYHLSIHYLLICNWQKIFLPRLGVGSSMSDWYFFTCDGMTWSYIFFFQAKEISFIKVMEADVMGVISYELMVEMAYFMASQIYMRKPMFRTLSHYDLILSNHSHSWKTYWLFRVCKCVFKQHSAAKRLVLGFCS
jgi:hypothetical protein